MFFDYNDISDSLSISETKTYTVPAYTQSPKNIVDQNGIASIKTNTDGMTGNYTFSDAPSFNLNVVNTLLIDVKFKADNFIDDDESSEFTIFADEEEKTTAIIYTKKPVFTSLIDYPVIIDWNFKDDTVFVVIR